MENLDGKWVKWILLAIFIGYIIGQIITKILKFFITSAAFELLINLITPLFMIAGIFVFLYLYNKQKEK